MNTPACYLPTLASRVSTRTLAGKRRAPLSLVCGVSRLWVPGRVGSARRVERHRQRSSSSSSSCSSAFVPTILVFYMLIVDPLKPLHRAMLSNIEGRQQTCLAGMSSNFQARIGRPTLPRGPASTTHRSNVVSRHSALFVEPPILCLHRGTSTRNKQSKPTLLCSPPPTP